MFKVNPPSAQVEEEVEALLEQEAPVEKPESDSEFDAAFDQAKAEQETEAASPELDTEEPFAGGEEESSGVDAPPEDDFSDLFDDQDGEAAEPASEPDETLFEGGEEELFGDEPPKDSRSEDSADGLDEVDDLFGDDEPEAQEPAGDDADMGGLFDEEAEAESEAGDEDLFADDDEDGDEEEDESLFEQSLDLDEKPKRSLTGIIILLAFVLLIGGGVYFKAWTLVGIDLGSYFQNVPYVGSWFADEAGQDVEPGESPEQRVNKIELKNVRQFYAKNEKAGVLFVIQGTAVNNFATPKERIEVQAQLFDAQSKVVASQQMLCGNVLSMFQLQVQSRKEIEDGLKSEVGILSNNTFLRPGASTPFMFVFFEQPVNDIKEFGVKVVDAKTPK
jgi:intracellular sulfur oxidation DsrE/DsrF family protein